MSEGIERLRQRINLADKAAIHEVYRYRNVAMIIAEPACIAEILTYSGKIDIRNKLPHDAIYVDRFEREDGTIALIYEHKSFPLLVAGASIEAVEPPSFGKLGE